MRICIPSQWPEGRCNRRTVRTSLNEAACCTPLHFPSYPQPLQLSRMSVIRNLLIVAAMVIGLPVWAQPAAGPQFEAAWVKPNSSIEMSLLIPANAKLMGKHVSLMRLISFAYNLPYPRISGASWLDSAAFDIQAKGPVGLRDADIRLMTQALLAERFGLQCHRETKAAKVYFLVSDSGGGLKMVPADEPQRPHPKFPPGPHSTMGADGVMGDLADYLSRFVGAPVVDRTGVAGKFHYYLWWGSNPDTDPDIFQAVKAQLGLKLQSGKSDVEFLVIDRVSRTPSEN
jgi:uncharacterized protein (TIGR03435 family)